MIKPKPPSQREIEDARYAYKKMVEKYEDIMSNPTHTKDDLELLEALGRIVHIENLTEGKGIRYLGLVTELLTKHPDANIPKSEAVFTSWKWGDDLLEDFIVNLIMQEGVYDLDTSFNEMLNELTTLDSVNLQRLGYGV